MLAVGMIVGSPLLSYISTNVLRSRKKVIVLSSVVVFCLTACLAFITNGIPLWAHYVLCFCMGVFASAVVVIAFTANKELFPVQIAGTATGLVNLFPFAGGAVFQPILGYVLEKQGRVGDAFTMDGYQRAFLVLFLCSAIALASSFFVKETLE
jgi:MFS family permease